MVIPPSLRRVSSRGYTAIEVMLAMTVLLIGSAGVMSMQKASIQSNLDARKLDIANSIAHEWLERLTADATQWTLPAVNVNGASNQGNTNWVGNYSALPGVPFLPTLPTGTPEGLSPAFDILGRDLSASNAANAIFCVHLNIVPLTWDTMAPPNPLLLRATVVVFWPKQLVQSATIPAGFCTSANSGYDVAAAEAAKPGMWHIIYATTGIRRNP